MFRLSAAQIKPLYEHRPWPNLKIPLFYLLWIGLGYLAWNSTSIWLTCAYYLGMGYIQMRIVTFMHDCTHSVLFKARWKNWAFGIISMIPLVISFMSFKDDHLQHHQFNRTEKDPDAFTMGRRSFVDYLLFYTYFLLGSVLLSTVWFGFLYAVIHLRGRKVWIHWSEMALHASVYYFVLTWAYQNDILIQVLQIWLIPIVVLGYLNAVRFVAEHYGTPWNGGQLLGTRTIISNQVNSWFWNNINYHIGHHVYPAVPWYNLQELHALVLPEITRVGAIVDKSYFGVFFNAFIRGPETPETSVARRMETPLSPVPAN